MDNKLLPPIVLIIALLSVGAACDSAGSDERPAVAVGTPAPPAPAPPPPSKADPADVPITPVTGEINGGCAPDGVKGHQVKTCPADDAEVVFDVDVPDVCVTRACGVILDVHGWSMTGPMQSLHTRLSELTQEKRFITIHPTGPGKVPSWGKGKSPYSDDYAYDPTVWGFVEATITRFVANTKHVHVTGFSQGAMMSFRMAFAHADRIASVAPIAGPSGFADPSPFGSAKATGKAPSRHLPILYIHGTRDKELNFDGNAIVVRDEIVKAYDLALPDTLHAETTLRAYAYKENKKDEKDEKNEKTEKNGNVIFEFWEHDYVTANDRTVGGHCVAGPVEKGDGAFYSLGRQKTPSERPFRCVDADQAFDAGKEILRFFEEHPMP